MMQLFAVLLFFSIGFISVCLPFSLSFRYRLVQILLVDTNVLIWIGLGFFGLTLLFTFGFFGLSRGRFLLLHMGENRAEVDIPLLRQMIQPLLQKQFASRILLTDVEVFKSRHLQIGLSLVPMEGKEKELLLLSAEHHLRELLAERFNYRSPFTVQVKA